MGSLLTINVVDVNGENSNTKFWCNDVPTAIGAVQSVANLSNAQVVSAFLTEELDISTLESNNAVAANIETVKEKVKVRLSGPDAGSAGAPRLTTTISIPAPLGSLINGLEGDPANVLLTPFIGKVTTSNGLATDTIDRVYYSRSR